MIFALKKNEKNMEHVLNTYSAARKTFDDALRALIIEVETNASIPQMLVDACIAKGYTVVISDDMAMATNLKLANNRQINITMNRQYEDYTFIVLGAMCKLGMIDDSYRKYFDIYGNKKTN